MHIHSYCYNIIVVQLTRIRKGISYGNYNLLARIRVYVSEYLINHSKCVLHYINIALYIATTYMLQCYIVHV